MSLRALMFRDRKHAGYQSHKPPVSTLQPYSCRIPQSRFPLTLGLAYSNTRHRNRMHNYSFAIFPRGLRWQGWCKPNAESLLYAEV